MESDFNEKTAYTRQLELVSEKDRKEFLEIIDELYKLKARMRQIKCGEEKHPRVSRFNFCVSFGMILCHEEDINDLYN